MVLAILGIYLFIGIRLILQAWIPRGLMSIKKSRVVLGIIWIPLESITYLDELVTYVPGTFCCPPMPSEIFLAWLVLVVVDILYQFHVITKMSK